MLFRLIDPAVASLPALLNALAFGLVLVFAQRLDNHRSASALITIAVCLCFALSLYTSITNEVFLATLATRVVVYSCYWSPFFICSTIAVIYQARTARNPAAAA